MNGEEKISMRSIRVKERLVNAMKETNEHLLFSNSASVLILWSRHRLDLLPLSQFG
jgi:hypothetical protein